jgi:hypothetical protein
MFAMMQEVLPDSAEAWAFMTLVFTTLTAGVGWAVKHWADRKIASANETAKTSADVASRLALAQERLVASAETREKKADERLQIALAGINELTKVNTELSGTLKLTFEEVRRLGEEVRRAGSNIESLLRDRH